VAAQDAPEPDRTPRLEAHSAIDDGSGCDIRSRIDLRLGMDRRPVPVLTGIGHLRRGGQLRGPQRPVADYFVVLRRNRRFICQGNSLLSLLQVLVSTHGKFGVQSSFPGSAW